MNSLPSPIQMNCDADVIIAGAGPAGTLAAYDLASNGIQVLILEKSLFPRYKVCGAGLTHKTLAYIPFDISPVIDQTIYSIRFSRSLTDTFLRQSEQPLIHCTMRDTLDAFLLQQALNAGASIRFQEHVSDINQDGNGVSVGTRSGNLYRSRFLIGADGASSVVSGICGMKKSLSVGMAWEAEMEAEPGETGKFARTVFLDWGSFPGGYGWIFPKKDHFSVGVGGPARFAGHLMPYFRRFTASSTIRFTHSRSMRSWPVPVRGTWKPLHHQRILVAGDAAGLTDPLSGEGICFAIRSGRLAAESILTAFSRPAVNLTTYSSAIRSSLMPEIREAKRVMVIFNAIPGTIHRLIRDNDRVWRAFGKILRGERSYLDVKRGFGRWRFLWGAATQVAGWFYRLKRPDYT